ncbi:MAG TPA: adenosine deaminase [Candidatus Binatia bacterium]|nr:adenosine deaminase [Candidatus Binatia bacterium]
MRRLRVVVLAAAFAVLPFGSAAQERAAMQVREARAAQALDAVRTDPPRLRAFLQAMPKGADLHNHATGAVYAESLIGMGVGDGACVTVTFVSSQAPCDTSKGQQPLSAAISQGLWDKIVDAWSTRNVAKYPISGHDQFFDTFGKFGAITGRHLGDVVADALRQADEDRVAYVELMASFGFGAVRQVATAVHYTGDLAKLSADVTAGGLDDAVSAALEDVRATDAAARKDLGCDSSPREPGCAVDYRYIMQVARTAPIESVFTQTAVAFGLVKRSSRVVGVNYVAPEDNPVALRDYDLHMRIVRMLSDANPTVAVSLHAGELTLGLVPRSALDHHIRAAVEVAHAKRIGHGVDIAYESGHERTLAEMRSRRVLVEINLTSNDLILGVRGKEHPIMLYLKAGVPIALSTDDEGVERIDFSHEFQRAVETYGFSYQTLKSFIRNSLEYSFLPGRSLWQTTAYRALATPCASADPIDAPSPACSAYLTESPKAREQWRVEHDLAVFEARAASARR